MIDMDPSDLRRVFTFWTGDTPMDPSRKQAFGTTDRIGLDHIHLGKDEIPNWELPDRPFHPAYSLLSEVHKSDYLRCYFMHHHGGGYTDVKIQEHSWVEAIDRVLRRPLLIGAGYREIRGGTPFLERNLIDGSAYILAWRVQPSVARLGTNLMRLSYPVGIGNCAFFFRPNTWFTRLWYEEVRRRLDLLLPDLKTKPPLHARDRRGGLSGMPYGGYPIPWSFLLGDVLGPLGRLACPMLARSLPRICNEGYRE